MARRRRPPSGSGTAAGRVRRRDADEPPVTLDDLARADGSEVTELLAEVAQFRLALDTDLTIAAAAAEAAAELDVPRELSIDLTRQTIEETRPALLELGRTAARHGATGPSNRPDAGDRPGRRRRRLPMVPLSAGLPIVALAVTLGLGGGALVTHHGSSGGTNLSAAADSSLASLTVALRSGDPAAATQAGDRLQSDVGHLISQASSNPAAAQAAQTVLLAEQAVLANVPGPVGDRLRAQLSALLTQLDQAVATTAPQLPGTGASAAVATAASAVPSSARRVVVPPLPSAKLPTGLPTAVPSAVRSLTVLPTLLPTPATATPSHAGLPSAGASATATPSVPATASPSATATRPGLTLPTAAATPTATDATGTTGLGLGH